MNGIWHENVAIRGYLLVLRTRNRTRNHKRVRIGYTTGYYDSMARKKGTKYEVQSLC